MRFFTILSKSIFLSIAYSWAIMACDYPSKKIVFIVPQQSLFLMPLQLIPIIPQFKRSPININYPVTSIKILEKRFRQELLTLFSLRKDVCLINWITRLKECKNYYKRNLLQLNIERLRKEIKKDSDKAFEAAEKIRKSKVLLSMR